MSVALKSQPEETARSAAVSASRRRQRLTLLKSPLQSTIAPFPTEQRQSSLPFWLKLLIAGQRCSFAIAVVTVVGAIVAYALTVNTNRRLAIANATLAQLQAQQQQLTTANAVFKNHLAQSASNSALGAMLHPKNVIFLEESPALTETPAATQPTTTTPDKASAERPFPTGY